MLKRKIVAKRENGRNISNVSLTSSQRFRQFLDSGKQKLPRNQSESTLNFDYYNFHNNNLAAYSSKDFKNEE